MTQSADVTFIRTGSTVKILLSQDGDFLASSTSPESIASELQIRGIRFLTLAGMFSTALPTSAAILASAWAVGFPEPTAALGLIAACAAVGKASSFPLPGRRSMPKSEVQVNPDAYPGTVGPLAPP